jgi:hypothetical protein
MFVLYIHVCRWSVLGIHLYVHGIHLSVHGTSLFIPFHYLENASCLSATKSCADNWLYHVHTLYLHVHTLYIHVHTLYIHVHCLYISPTHYMKVPLWYFPLQPRLYRLQEAIYNASVHELAILFIPGSYRYIHPKNGSGRW